jgi:hypothetical protein
LNAEQSRSKNNDNLQALLLKPHNTNFTVTELVEVLLQLAPEASVNTGLNRTFVKNKAALNPYMLNKTFGSHFCYNNNM